MEKIHFKISINAPKEKVWNTMLDDKTYRLWTSSFMEGSHYQGSWNEGGKILFLGPEGSGMVSEITENRPYKFISIKHLGIVNKGAEDIESEEAKKWAPAFENYEFSEKDGKTTVSVEMDVLKDFKEMFQKMWPEALRKLKELSEQ